MKLNEEEIAKLKSQAKGKNFKNITKKGHCMYITGMFLNKNT